MLGHSGHPAEFGLVHQQRIAEMVDESDQTGVAGIGGIDFAALQQRVRSGIVSCKDHAVGRHQVGHIGEQRFESGILLRRAAAADSGQFRHAGDHRQQFAAQIELFVRRPESIACDQGAQRLSTRLLRPAVSGQTRGQRVLQRNAQRILLGVKFRENALQPLQRHLVFRKTIPAVAQIKCFGMGRQHQLQLPRAAVDRAGAVGQDHRTEVDIGFHQIGAMLQPIAPDGFHHQQQPGIVVQSRQQFRRVLIFRHQLRRQQRRGQRHRAVRQRLVQITVGQCKNRLFAVAGSGGVQHRAPFLRGPGVFLGVEKRGVAGTGFRRLKEQRSGQPRVVRGFGFQALDIQRFGDSPVGRGLQPKGGLILAILGQIKFIQIEIGHGGARHGGFLQQLLGPGQVQRHAVARDQSRPQPGPRRSEILERGIFVKRGRGRRVAVHAVSVGRHFGQGKGRQRIRIALEFGDQAFGRGGISIVGPGIVLRHAVKTAAIKFTHIEKRHRIAVLSGPLQILGRAHHVDRSLIAAETVDAARGFGPRIAGGFFRGRLTVAAGQRRRQHRGG
ncbi:hypothetical protein SDC9_74210 [bioreactor metagenome]|uniref:Uncharacterized protein n=1 Tax=bioreactor metagenome TaxID=1076179 RepID=A0A644YHE9_9ZZZZ